MRTTIFLLAWAVALAGCSPAEEEDWGEEGPEETLGGKSDSLDWSASTGAGSVNLTATAKKTISLGLIPAGRKDVTVKLTSSIDADLQLLDGSTKVVYRTYGLLKGSAAASTTYKGNEISWSGYYGDGVSRGNETLTIKGKTGGAFTLKVSFSKAGKAKLSYSFAVDTAPATGTFADRLQAFAQRYPSLVVQASKLGRPAIFFKTPSFSNDEAKVKEVFGELWKLLGPNTIMIWNPAGDNYFHLGLPDSKSLDAMFRQRAIKLYSHFHVWNDSLGNLDEPASGEYEDDYLDLVSDPVYDQEQIDRERTVALLTLTDAQLAQLNTYLKAIADDFNGTLGPADFNGGVPPYLGGDKHNCTSWFTNWLNKYVSSSFPTSVNPASLVSSVIGGGWSGSLAKEYLALLVFNHPSPPAAGTALPSSFPLDVGH